MNECPFCDGPLMLLEHSGRLLHLHCCSCGLGFSREDDAPNDDCLDGPDPVADADLLCPEPM